MALFTSQYEHTIDAKGRMFIPAKYRPMLGSSLVLGKNRSGNLYIMTTEGWNEYENKIMETVAFTEDEDLLRSIFKNIIETPIDSQGRILIPPNYLASAGLTDSAVIVGCGPKAEIWSPERWAEKEAELDDAVIKKKLVEYRL